MAVTPRITDGISRIAAEVFRNEPALDFSRSEVRDAFQKALAEARRLFPIHAPLVIDGRKVDTPEFIPVVSPNDTSMALGQSACASEPEADEAIRAASRASGPWSRRRPVERADLLLRLADVMRKRRLLLAAIEVFESAKPWAEADADVCEAIDYLEYYSREAIRLGEPVRLQPHIAGERNEQVYSPVGVVGVIGPWNFPLAIPLGMASAALAAGNTVVWKPAEQSPLIISLAAGLMEECGFPAGVVNYLPGPGETAGRRLVESPDVRMIAFTGSRAVGVQILRVCGQIPDGQAFVKRTVTEMGGKNAIILDSSADMDAGIPIIIHSAFGYSGQKCSACSRLIIVEDVYGQATQRLRDAMGSLTIAASWDPACRIGPLIDAEARFRVEQYIEMGLRDGHALFLGDAGGLKMRGHFVAPAAFEDIPESHPLAQQEVFGPVLTVMRARSFDEALDLANATEYGLTGGVLSRTLKHVEMAKALFQCGSLYINRTITGAVVGRQPFGGYKMSGAGSKAGGPDYLKHFMVPRCVSENMTLHGFAPVTQASSGDGGAESEGL